MTIRPKYETQSRHNPVTRPSKRDRKAAYEAVASRSWGVCEGCGGEAVAMHHRLYRSRGGEDTVANLLHVCVACHLVAHTIVGEHLGWSVKTGNDPAEVPIFHRHTGLWTRGGNPITAFLATELLEGLGQMQTGLDR